MVDVKKRQEQYEVRLLYMSPHYSGHKAIDGCIPADL
jgi:hypothetical protein